MAKNDKKKANAFRSFFESLREETIHGIWAIIFFVLSIFLLLAALNSAGVAGAWTYKTLSFVFGIGYFLIPALFVILAVSFLSTLKEHFGQARVIGSVLFFISGLGLIDTLADGRGGFVGGLVSAPLLSFVDLYATLLILGALLIISILILFDLRPSLAFMRIPLNRLKTFFYRQRKQSVESEVDIVSYPEEEAGDESEIIEDEISNDEENVEEAHDELDKKESKSGVLHGLFGAARKIPFNISDIGAPYATPPLSIFEKDSGKPGVGDIKANANIIKRTLQNFGINVEMDEVSIGPSVTRYALKPAEGVRLSKIIGLQNNLELALAASPVRIEAPIPGRSLVGIEVPNHTRSLIGLASLIGKEEYKKSHKPLLLALGKDIAGNCHYADLGKMPHLLIAGATGSGKSVTIHSIVASLLFRNSPQQLRLIMIDPKRVELTLYNGIPHLLTPVITSAKNTILALKWAANEMERRYNILEAEQVRDVDSYHKNVLAPALEKARKHSTKESGADEELPEPLPYIVIILDELADIMQMYPRELEAATVRLAQMSRAVGIHLILSTQRPSVNVITGLIKANIPARIALQVSSQIDSRTILDSSGAERLIGAGDMLYLSGEMSKPKRLQSAFISEQEVKKLASFIRKHADEMHLPELDFSDESVQNFGLSTPLEDDDADDELYDDAKEEIVKAGKASTSYLQRKFRIGYSRAARLMDILEERGVIGPADGSKPREVLETFTSDREENLVEKYQGDIQEREP